jgi:serine/threonine-protein kinase
LDNNLDFVKQLFRKSARYEVMDLIGQGGMGQVYRAIDRELDEVVALKLLKPRLSSDPVVIARFKQEIKLTRRIKHKNVARIFDLGEVGGFKFISMEYIDGKTLKDLLLSRGPLTLDLAIHIYKQVLEGVGAAHEEGIVHRDIKPQNIMVSRDFATYVLDFGIARSLESEDLFAMGVLVGSPAYMSTEQVLRKEVDHRSDVYSLGVLLFEMLTGQPPFQARSLVAAANKHVTERPPDPRTLRPDLPEWVSRFVLKCLEKEPGLRFQNLREMLGEIARHESDVADTISPEAVRVPVAPVVVPPVAAPPAKKRMQVLLGEADPETARVVRGKLESLGLEVEHVPDGVAAVDRAVTGRFDLILLGTDLPRLDGIEATRILKKYSATKDVPVVMLVPSGRSDQESFAYDSGAADVLIKPINALSLAKKTRSLLSL